MKTSIENSRNKVSSVRMLVTVAALELACSASEPLPADRREGSACTQDLQSVWETDLAPLAGKYMHIANHTTVVPTRREGREVGIAVHELGSGRNDSIILLVHGVFSWSGIWRYVVPGLIAEHDVWLIDLPGCGWSEKPHPKKLAPDGYSPEALADRVMQAMLRQSVPFDEKTRQLNFPRFEYLEDFYDRIDIPTVIVWGERDDVLSECTGHKIKDKIPGARLVEIERCGHSIPRECPRKVTAIINAFIDGN